MPVTAQLSKKGSDESTELLSLAAGAAASAILYPLDSSPAAFAADAGPDAPVVLTRNDGTIPKGKISAYNRDKVTSVRSSTK
jgi:hypothetical protein